MNKAPHSSDAILGGTFVQKALRIVPSPSLQCMEARVSSNSGPHHKGAGTTDPGHIKAIPWTRQLCTTGNAPSWHQSPTTPESNSMDTAEPNSQPIPRTLQSMSFRTMGHATTSPPQRPQMFPTTLKLCHPPPSPITP